MSETTFPELRLGIGGPLNRFERVARLESWGRLVAVALVIGWVPLMVLDLISWLATRRHVGLLLDLSVHMRLVVAIPLFLLAERLLDRRCRTDAARLVGEGYIPPDEEPRYVAILASAVRLRDSIWPEVVILLIAAVGGMSALAGWTNQAGVLHGASESSTGTGATLVTIWYCLISLPLFQFLLWRSLWRWTLWVRVLFGVSRLRLDLVPTHADQRAGLRFLARPSAVFFSVLLFGLSCVLASAWGMRILHAGAHVAQYKSAFLGFVVLGELLAYGPLLLFAPRLYAARIEGRERYDKLSAQYARRFDARWLEGDPGEEMLGHPDFQSLADLISTYQTSVERVVPILFGARELVGLVVVTAIPMLPVILLEMPLEEVLRALRGVIGA